MSESRILEAYGSPNLINVTPRAGVTISWIWHSYSVFQPYPGHEDLRRRSHFEAKVESTVSQCIRGGTHTTCEAHPRDTIIIAGGCGVYCNNWLWLFWLTVYRHPAKYTFGFYCTRGGLLLGEDCHTALRFCIQKFVKRSKTLKPRWNRLPSTLGSS